MLVNSWPTAIHPNEGLVIADPDPDRGRHAQYLIRSAARAAALLGLGVKDQGSLTRLLALIEQLLRDDGLVATRHEPSVMSVVGGPVWATRRSERMLLANAI